MFEGIKLDESAKEVTQLTSEVEDKKSENCRHADDCPQLKAIPSMEGYITEWQPEQAALAICASCDEFEAAPKLPTHTITVNVFEAGVLMGMIEKEADRVRSPLSNVWMQLVELKKKVDKADGVVKKLLPNGMLELSDADGNRIIRPPYSWEVEGN